MKNRKILFPLILLSLAATMSSCIVNMFCINGNGIIESEQRSISGFSSISNSTSAEVVLTTGESPGIIIETDSNLLQYFETRVRGNTLEIETRGANCIRPTGETVIFISADMVFGISSAGSGDFFADTLLGEYIDLQSTGSGDIFLDYAEGDEININMTGSGNITVYDSWTDNVDIRITGSGDLSISGDSSDGNFTSTGSGECYAGDLQLLISDILISGSGDVYTKVSDELIVTITGSGDVFYRGDPDIYSNITGSGRIIRIN